MQVHADYPKDGQMVSLGRGLAMPESFVAWTEANHNDATEDVPAELEMTCGVENGRVVVNELRAIRRPGAPPVTGKTLRMVPLAAFIRLAVEDVAEMDGSANVLRQQDAAHIRSLGMSDEALEAVSLRYRLALLVGDPPRKSVEQMLNASRATATRWISAAVERDFLDAATAQRAGSDG